MLRPSISTQFLHSSPRSEEAGGGLYLHGPFHCFNLEYAAPESSRDLSRETAQTFALSSKEE
jgi:hypothetical protein